MVVKDQCELPARNPGSSKQAPPPPPAIGFGNRFQLGQEGKCRLCGSLLLLNGFFAGLQDGRSGKILSPQKWLTPLCLKTI